MDFVHYVNPTTPFLMDNIKLDEIPTKIKWKIHASLTLYLKFWEGTSVKNYTKSIPVLSFLVVLHQVLYQQMSFLTTFQNFIQHYLQKDFCQKFYFLNRFAQTPYLLNDQNLLSVTKVFCQSSLMPISTRGHIWSKFH